MRKLSAERLKDLGSGLYSGHHLRIITLTFQDVTLLSPCSPLLRPVLPLSQLSGALSRKAGLFLWRAKSVHHSVFCFLPSKILLLSSSLLFSLFCWFRAFVCPLAIILVVFLEGEAVNVCILSLNRNLPMFSCLTGIFSN